MLFHYYSGQKAGEMKNKPGLAGAGADLDNSILFQFSACQNHHINNNKIGLSGLDSYLVAFWIFNAISRFTNTNHNQVGRKFCVFFCVHTC